MRWHEDRNILQADHESKCVGLFTSCSARTVVLIQWLCIFFVLKPTHCQERLCQFWLNTFFIAQRTKTGEEDECAIFGEDKQYIVSLCKPELDKINKDKKHKIVPKDFKVLACVNRKPIPFFYRKHKPRNIRLSVSHLGLKRGAIQEARQNPV